MAEAKQRLLTKTEVDSLIDRWLNDPSFARQLKDNPSSALRSCGLEPGRDLVESLRNVDSSTPIEELQRRVSKGTTLN